MEQMLWQKELEKVGGPAIVEVFGQLLQKQTDTLAMVEDLQNHITEMDRKHDAFIAAFPEGDMDGHRRYHTAVIENMELRNEIKRDLLKKLIQSGFAIGVGWALLALWKAFIVAVKT